MSNRKASLYGIPLIILLVSILIITSYLGFLYLTKTEKKDVDDAKEIVGTNMFVIGMLKSQLLHEGNKITLSELISYQDLKQNKNYTDAIRSHINSLLRQMYGKDICWKMTAKTWSIDDEVDECSSLPKKESISSSVIVPGFERQSFEIKFETVK